jgi:hypothetical protein
MAQVESAAAMLETRLERLEEGAKAFLRGMGVRRVSDRHTELIFLVPEYQWNDPSDEQRRIQLRLRNELTAVHERLALLLGVLPGDLQHSIEESKKNILHWLDLEWNWSLTADPESNVRHLSEAFASLRSSLRIVRSSGEGECLAIPDTNALTAAPDPTWYAGPLESQSFQFVLLSTVLSELDNLKYQARNETYRTKVERVIRRIAGWRRQGNLLDGVTVAGTITVKAIAQEPNFGTTLSWLDASNKDDRIIASTLEVQRLLPAARVLLFTGDINLQNKAVLAAIPVAEPPKPPSASRRRTHGKAAPTRK